MLKRRASAYGVGPAPGRLVEVEGRAAHRRCRADLRPARQRPAGRPLHRLHVRRLGRRPLVPFAKAYSGLTDEEIRQVDAFVRRNTLEKFGPVRTVKPELVFELAFEGIQRSTRHKSGIAVRFPRMARWRTDKRPEEADTLETVRGLLIGGRARGRHCRSHLVTLTVMPNSSAPPAARSTPTRPPPRAVRHLRRGAPVHRLERPAVDHARAAARRPPNQLDAEGPGLIGIGTEPKFAIGQRALHVRTAERRLPLGLHQPGRRRHRRRGAGAGRRARPSPSPTRTTTRRWSSGAAPSAACRSTSTRPTASGSCATTRRSSSGTATPARSRRASP